MSMRRAPDGSENADWPSVTKYCRLIRLPNKPFATAAQWIAHRASNSTVAGSIPAGGASNFPVNYYNENDPKAAAWLRQLIAVDAIVPQVAAEFIKAFNGI